MKRHNFRGLPASHGCSKRHRAPGGLGRQNSINKGVPKGKRMAGHMGDERVTIQALEVVKIDAENNLLLVKGAVPGANGGYVLVNKGIVEKVIADSAAKKGKK
jgi:large subunit ribosomal protein L3